MLHTCYIHNDSAVTPVIIITLHLPSTPLIPYTSAEQHWYLNGQIKRRRKRGEV